MKRFTLCILSACLLTGGTIVGAESESLFSKDAVVPVELRIDPDGIGALRQNPREYVRGRIRRDTNMLTEVEVRLKGNANFRSIGQKASFSLKLGPSSAA